MLRHVWPLPLPRASLFHGASALALAVLCVNIYADSQQKAGRMIALREGSPASVAVESFELAQHSSATGEVMVRAQVDTSLPLQVVFRQAKGLRRALAYPVLAVDAQGSRADVPILGYFYADTPLPEAEILDFAQILPPFEKVGEFGPVVSLNGELNAPPELGAAVAALLAEAGRPAAQTLLGITPYPNGRYAALAAPRPSAWRLALLSIALAFFAAGLVMSQVHPLLSERRRLAEIGRSGRKRSGLTPEMETQKARNRLAPIAPEPEIRAKHRAGPLKRLVIGGWRRVCALRNPG